MILKESYGQKGNIFKPTDCTYIHSKVINIIMIYLVMYALIVKYFKRKNFKLFDALHPEYPAKQFIYML